jgi:16S rRNA (cytidine1402-2'-O)-methyltransferase
MREIAAERRTTILYESPHRLLKALNELIEHCGELRRAVVCRELTKLHEEIQRGTVAQLRDTFAARSAIKGEIVIIVEGQPRASGRIEREGERDE